MTRLEWQQLAERWLTDARVLLDARRWSAAYYLAGYAAECGLKACVLARVAASPEVVFGDRRFSDRCWTHNPVELVKLAALEADLAAHAAAEPTFNRNWLVVKDWSELARYRTTTYQRAKRLYDALTGDPHGVMTWIRVRW